MGIEAILMISIGALAAVMANKSIAVFHDGLRPIMPEYMEGRMKKTELAATSFAISIGLVIGFGIPVSLAGQVILLHSILLSTDIIGTWAPEGRAGAITAAVVGGVYGYGLLRGLEFIVNIFESLPVNFVEDLGTVGDPIIVAFAVFPILATAFQYDVKKAVYNFFIVVFVRQLTIFITPLTLAGAEMNINEDGMALAAGMIVLIYYAISEGKVETKEGEGMAGLFSKRVDRIKKYLPLFAISGGLIGVATVVPLLAGNPMSLELQAAGTFGDAGLTYIARGLAFMPLVGATAIATGVYTPAGMKFIHASACFTYVASGSLILAGIASAITIVAEILLLGRIAVLLDSYPGIKNAGNNIRTAIVQVLEIALLIGGAMAAQNIMSGFGIFAVVAIYFLNEQADQPIKRMAVGPVAAISVGVIANIFAIVGIL